MVDVAQLVEPRIVIPAVAGSSPVVHPTSIRKAIGSQRQEKFLARHAQHLPFGDPDMATLSPFWDSEWRLHRHFAIDLTRMAPLIVWQLKLGAPSNQFGKLR